MSKFSTYRENTICSKNVETLKECAMSNGNFYMCWKLKTNEIEKTGTKVTSLCKCLGIICF